MIEIGSGDSLVVAGVSPVDKVMKPQVAKQNGSIFISPENSETESDDSSSEIDNNSPTERFSKRRFLKTMSLRILKSTGKMASNAVLKLYRTRVRRIEETLNQTESEAVIDVTNSTGGRKADVMLHDTSKPFFAARADDPTSFFSTRQSHTFEDILRGSEDSRRKFFLLRVTDPTSYFYKYHFEGYPIPQPRRMQIHLVQLDWLKPHEQIVSDEKVAGLKKATIMWDAYTKPLLVDRKTGAILDGHHRFTVGKQLGLKRVPAVLVDYLEDESITVDVWPGCGLDNISKQDVIDMSLSNAVYPPKTSRHQFSDEMPPIRVPLATLRMNS